MRISTVKTYPSPPDPDLIILDCNRPSRRYHVGERAVFTIRSASRQMVDVSLSNDGGVELKHYHGRTPIQICHSFSAPGFLRCTVSQKDRQDVMLGVAFDPESIRPVLDKPEDFDRFWEKNISGLNAGSPDICVQPVSGRKGYDCSLISCAAPNNKRQYAFLAVPRTKNPVPLLVHVGGGESFVSQEMFFQYWDEVRGRFEYPFALLYIHLPPYEPADTIENAKARHAEYLKKLGNLKSFTHAELEKTPRDIYSYCAIMGGLRLIDIAAEYPAIKKDNICYHGASHGGAFGIYFAAFSKHFRTVFTGVPALGDFGGILAGRPANFITRGFHSEKILRNLQYYDTAYCAERITAPVMLSTGFIDVACSPTSVYSICNSLKCRKLMFDKIDCNHAPAPPEYEPLTWTWTGCGLFSDRLSL